MSPKSFQTDGKAEPSKLDKNMGSLAKKGNLKKGLTEKEVRRLSQLIDGASTAEQQKFFAALSSAEKLDDSGLQELVRTSNKKKLTGRPRNEEEENVLLERSMLAWKLKTRGLNTMQIAKQMECNKNTVTHYIAKALDHMQVDPKDISLPHQIGETLNFYSDVRAMAMFIASDGSRSTSQRLMAMNVALKAEADKTDFLAKVGFYGTQVVQQFQQLVSAQLALLIGGQKDEIPAIDEFFQNLANDLMANALTHSRAKLLPENAEGVAEAAS